MKMKRGLKTRGGFKASSTMRKVAKFSRRILKSDPVQAELKKTRRGMTAESILDKLTLGDLQGVASKAIPEVVRHVGMTVGSDKSRHRGAVIQDGAYGGIKSSSMIYKLHNRRKGTINDQRYRYVSNRNVRLTSALNKQNQVETALLLAGWRSTPTVINTDLPTPNNNYPVATLANFMGTLWSPTATASPYVNGAAIPNYLTFKLDLESIRVKTLISNASTASCILDVYEVIPKLDSAWSQALFFYEGAGTYSPTFCWKQGLEDIAYESGAGAGQYKAEVLNASPTQSLMFNTYFKIVKQTTIELPPGAVHVHNSFYELNAMLNAFRCFYTTGQLQGVTPTFMFNLRGVPINDISVASAIGISASAVDIEQEIDYTYVAPALSGTSVINNTAYPEITQSVQTGVETQTQTQTTG